MVDLGVGTQPPTPTMEERTAYILFEHPCFETVRESFKCDLFVQGIGAADIRFHHLEEA